MEAHLEKLTVAISNKLKKLIGKSTDPVVFEVEKGQIRRFAAAVGEENSIHTDEVQAKACGYPSMVAPPTFAGSLCALDDLKNEIGLDYRSTMHAEEEYEYFQPICAGDKISITHQVVNAYDKQAPNGRLVFIVIETRGTDSHAKPVFKGRKTLVELKN